MPFKLTKGDLARQPVMCAEIVALRVQHKQVQARIAYLDTKDTHTSDEQTEKAAARRIWQVCRQRSPTCMVR